ncbi:hypothetical protein [Micropruina sp.]|uniref:hypothetical protein n=1 Tax=Micropruina sp. TaxID=2737536 RepID=UPI0039E64D3C
MAQGVACVLALVVTAGVLLWSQRRPGDRPSAASGLALLLGAAAGGLALWGLGAATNLVVIVLVPALLLGLVEALLSARSLHWFWRLVAQGVVILGVLAFEWRRGDLFASGAAMAAVVGVLGFNVIVFGVGAAQRSDAPRVPAVLGLLGAGYLLLVAFGLPNPGLASLALLVASITVPLLVFVPPSGVIDRALGPVLGGLGLALAYLAWLGNASPAMVVAPLLLVVVDVVYSLARRVVTESGRSSLGGGGWWKAIDAWANPSDDLVAQRSYASGSITALLWLGGGTLLVLALSLVTWWVGVPWLVALVVLIVPALGWLVLQAPLLSSSRRALLTSLGVVAGVAVLGVVLAWRSDGRLPIVALPLLMAALVWGAALLTRRQELLPAKVTS